jgi:hypothetical protein
MGRPRRAPPWQRFLLLLSCWPQPARRASCGCGGCCQKSPCMAAVKAAGVRRRAATSGQRCACAMGALHNTAEPRLGGQARDPRPAQRNNLQNLRYRNRNCAQRSSAAAASKHTSHVFGLWGLGEGQEGQMREAYPVNSEPSQKAGSCMQAQGTDRDPRPRLAAAKEHPQADARQCAGLGGMPQRFAGA